VGNERVSRISELSSPLPSSFVIRHSRHILLIPDHRRFLERPVLEGLFWLIHDDYPAAKRHLLKYKGTKNPADYWVKPP
jgi:hypothetical protein